MTSISITDKIAPLPPPRPKRRYEPMTLAEAERWVASYNAWVEVWNKHERSRDLPLSPDWPEAENIGLGSPVSAVLFQVRATGRMGAMRFRGYRHFAPGWSFCRNPVELDRLVWAGWRAQS